MAGGTRLLCLPDDLVLQGFHSASGRYWPLRVVSRMMGAKNVDPFPSSSHASIRRTLHLCLVRLCACCINTSFNSACHPGPTAPLSFPSIYPHGARFTLRSRRRLFRCRLIFALRLFGIGLSLAFVQYESITPGVNLAVRSVRSFALPGLAVRAGRFCASLRVCCHLGAVLTSKI